MTVVRVVIARRGSMRWFGCRSSDDEAGNREAASPERTLGSLVRDRNNADKEDSPGPSLSPALPFTPVAGIVRSMPCNLVFQCTACSWQVISDQYRSLYENPETNFNNRVLFRGQNLESIPTREMWLSLSKELTTLRPDVVFVYGYSLRIMRQITFWAQWKGVGVVLISDTNEFDRTRYKPLEVLKSLFVSRVDSAFVGGTNSSLYLQKLGFPQGRIVTGYDTVDNQAFFKRTDENRRAQSQVQKRWSLPDNYFLFVGRIIKEKNLERLLNAYKRYAAYVGSDTAPWSLVICGSGPGEEGLRQIVERMPQQLQERVLIYGRIRQTEIVDFLSCASCLVLPSTSESWGLVVNEAMACKLPVLVSKQAGCAADLVQGRRDRMAL